MNKEDAAQFVIRALKKHKSRNEIIVSLCTDSEMSWQDAEAFIADIEDKHAAEIARGGRPMILFLSLGSILIGSILAYLGGSRFLSLTMGVVNKNLTAALDLPYVYSWGATFLTGVGMLLGGLLGLGNNKTKL